MKQLFVHSRNCVEIKLGFDRIGTVIIFSEPNQYELNQDEVQH